MKREIIYYLIFMASTMLPLPLLSAAEKYLFGSEGAISTVMIVIVSPFIIGTIFIDAILEGNPHSSGPEWRFYTIVVAQVFVFLTVVWVFSRWVYKKGRNQ